MELINKESLIEWLKSSCLSQYGEGEERHIAYRYVIETVESSWSELNKVKFLEWLDKLCHSEKDTSYAKYASYYNVFKTVETGLFDF